MKTITLSGVVGYDTTAADIRQALDEAAGGDVRLVVSSPGGLVADAIDIYNMLRRYPGATEALLSGYAMSAASYIPLACDRVLAEDNAVMMIHNAQGLAWGDHNTLLKYGTVLKSLSATLRRAYEQKSGRTADELQAMMDEETYLFGDEIAGAGFADEMVDAEEGEDDRDGAEAVASEAFAAMAGRLAADRERVTADLGRAMNLAKQASKRQPATAVTAAPPPQIHKEITMDLKTLKEQHQELVAAIAQEVTASHEEALAAARADGAKAERDRIEDVRAQAIPGHEKIVEAMAFDGVSTGADCAKAIVAAEKLLRQQAQDQQQADANALVPPATPPAGAMAMKRGDFDKLDAQAKRDHFAAGGTVVD